jgi:hypothetical protein
MLQYTMKNFMIILLMIFTHTSRAQNSVVVKDGMATLDGKPWLSVTEKHITKSSTYIEVKNLSDQTIAQITIQEKSDMIFFNGEFPVLVKKYQVYYPSGTTIQTILGSYNSNGVIVNGNIDLEGLQNYCDKRKIILLKMLNGEEQKHYNDSIKNLGKRFSFAMYAGGMYSLRHDAKNMRTLSVTNTPGEDYQTVRYSSRAEKGVATKNAGIYFEFRQRKKLSLNLGLNYTQVFYETKSNTTFYLMLEGDASPHPYYDTTSNLKIQERYYFVSIPICLSYRLNRGKNYYTFGGGVSLVACKSIIIETPGWQYGSDREVYGNDKPITYTGKLFARAGMFRNIGHGMSTGLESEFVFYPNQYNLFTAGLNLVMKF